MVDTPSPSFDRPIAGQALTAELGNRPWQQPPQYATVEEALEYYVPRLANPEFTENLFDVMETGIPLTTIANAMQSAGVMEGKHTIDVGLLIMPVLIETMAYLAEESDIEYVEGSNITTDPDKPSDSRIARAIAMVRKEQGEETKMEDMPVPEEQEVPQENTGGLMSRRSADGV